MSAYAIAWMVIIAAALIGGFGLWRLCARSRFGLLPWLATALAVTFFLTPITVPNYPQQMAPAFVVAVFELLFQTNGEPQASLRLLGLSMTAVSLLTLVLYFFLQRPAKSTKVQPTADTDNKTAAAQQQDPQLD